MIQLLATAYLCFKDSALMRVNLLFLNLAPCPALFRFLLAGRLGQCPVLLFLQWAGDSTSLFPWVGSSYILFTGDFEMHIENASRARSLYPHSHSCTLALLGISIHTCTPYPYNTPALSGTPTDTHPCIPWHTHTPAAFAIFVAHTSTISENRFIRKVAHAKHCG